MDKEKMEKLLAYQEKIIKLQERHLSELKKMIDSDESYVRQLSDDLFDVYYRMDSSTKMLPVKGDKFYYIDYPEERVVEYDVCDISIDSFTTNDHDTWIMSEYGETWFKTKEEAEAKLREMMKNV